MPTAAPDIEDPFPLTDAERRRAVALLASVGSRTLLQTLAHLAADRGDARLIIAALLDRLPAGDPVANV